MDLLAAGFAIALDDIAARRVFGQEVVSSGSMRVGPESSTTRWER